MAPEILRTLADIIHFGKQKSMESRINMAQKLDIEISELTDGNIFIRFRKNEKHYKRVVSACDCMFSHNPPFVFKDMIEERKHRDNMRQIWRDLNELMSLAGYDSLHDSVRKMKYITPQMGFSFWLERLIYLESTPITSKKVRKLTRKVSKEMQSLLESPNVEISAATLAKIEKAIYGE